MTQTISKVLLVILTLLLVYRSYDLRKLHRSPKEIKAKAPNPLPKYIEVLVYIFGIYAAVIHAFFSDSSF